MEALFSIRGRTKYSSGRSLFRSNYSDLAVFNGKQRSMKKSYIVILLALLLVSLGMASCDAPTGAGAAYGAATGAIIGAAATGHARGAAIGAASGAAAGALIGHAIQEDQAARYDPVPEGGYPWAERSETPGLVVSPYYPHRLVDVRGIPHGALVRDPSSGGIFRKP
jgi:predicted small secreted protein